MATRKNQSRTKEKSLSGPKNTTKSSTTVNSKPKTVKLASKSVQKKSLESLEAQKELALKNHELALSMLGTEMNPMKRAFISQWLLNK